jgi:hypothetical protein
MITERLHRESRRAKLELRARIKRSPALYIPLARIRNGASDGMDVAAWASPEAVRNDTELVVDAPRNSGNHFAVIAFRLAQGRPVSVAHHLHAPAQIKRGAKRGIPTLVIVRNPRDFAISDVIRHPPITLEEALREWCDFYETIDALEGVLIADFRSVTSDFGEVIETLNRTFNTSFRRFEHTEANVERVFQIVDEVYQRRGYDDQKERRVVARPVPEREAERSMLADRYQSEELADLRARAESVYDRLTARLRAAD